MKTRVALDQEMPFGCCFAVEVENFAAGEAGSVYYCFPPGPKGEVVRGKPVDLF